MLVTSANVNRRGHGRPQALKRGSLLGGLAARVELVPFPVCLFLIARSVTAVYYSASRRLSFLMEHPVGCGLFYGMAVELVMSYVVLPLSALRSREPYELHDVLQGLLVHMFVVGLPISFSVRRFGK